ncbi:hypothetical protein F7725_003978 [Dissostichus mawsoni]|uniref:Uncharacterized protein n=1 Tax=Dissostichus mawsoni TaxID=36200 RepID=A0A7J5YBU4_DISMA|nr:hypothetical protein F7725_003978 [Dissostichus mawsoni]
MVYVPTRRPRPTIVVLRENPQPEDKVGNSTKGENIEKVVRVEKDPALEAEREHMRDLVMQERNLRRDQEDDTQNLHIRITHLHSSHSVTSEEETLSSSPKIPCRERRRISSDSSKLLEAQRNHHHYLPATKHDFQAEESEVISDLGRLEKEILNEKDKIHQRDTLIIECRAMSRERTTLKLTHGDKPLNEDHHPGSRDR